MRTSIFFKIFLCLTFFLLSIVYVEAQVTIGSSESPKTGALLDLKENNEDQENSTKGLLLPRVDLTQLNQLFPMLEENSEYLTDPATKQTQDDLHIGLIVFNTNQCIEGTGSDRGLYIWQGNKWIKIIDNVTKNSPKVLFNTDQEDKTFKSRKFEDAGEWMIENLSVSKYSDGTSIGSLGTNWGYPKNLTSSDNFNLQPQIGYLYKAATALNITESEIKSGLNDVRVQGVCPFGWHIPNDAEWIELEKEINKNTSLYASMADIGATWEANWSTAFNSSRGDFGTPMKSVCPPIGVEDPLSAINDGLSFATSAGGFSAILSGSSETDSFGENLKFWTSTAEGTGNLIGRLLNKGEEGVSRILESNNLLSIRCVKNGIFQCGDLLVDMEGNSYTTAKFGSVCWMTQNLRSTKNKNITLSKNENTTDTEELYYAHANNAATVNVAYGNLYTWKAAMGDNHSVETLIANEQGTIPSQVQGICPEGWVLPSDYDWNLLEEEIANNSLEYSSVQTTPNWSAIFAETIGWRPNETSGWGKAFKSATAVSGASNGTSIPSKGFEALLVGSLQSGIAAPSYGVSANLWTSSDVYTPLGADQNAKYRGLEASKDGLMRENASKSAMLGVRCLKRSE